MKYIKRNFLSDKLVVNLGILTCGLSFLVAALYAIGKMSITPVSFQIMGLGLMFMIPVILAKYGYMKISRIIMSYIVPVILMAMSIYNKQSAIQFINPVNYFDSRFIIIAALVIPMIIVPLNKWKLLLICLAPYAVSIVFYDPIHIIFGVDYYMVGLASSDYYFSANLFSIMTTVFLILGFMLLKYKFERSEYIQQFRRDRLATYMNELIRVSSSDPILSGNKEKTYAKIANAAELAMGNDKVSIWEFCDQYERKKCVLMSSDGHITHENIEMTKTDFPVYFERMLKDQVVIAEDAQNNEVLAAFNDAYLKPKDIRSMIEVAFRNNGRIAGVICCQTYNEQREYNIEDLIYLKALADTISYMHANRQREIRNEELERRVLERTKELTQKNQQLQEYAYIHSHILRAPVSRVQGLYNLLNIDIDEETLQHLRDSITELDDVTRKISMAIAELGDFDREKLMRMGNKQNTP